MKFIVGLLLGLILGIGGTAGFLISAGGGDYLVVTSPRVRELESSLKQADQEREWLRGQLRDSNEILVKLESRFVALATRFEDLGSHAATLLGAPPTQDDTSGEHEDSSKEDAPDAARPHAAAPDEPAVASPPSASPAPTESPAPTQTLSVAPKPTDDADDSEW